MCAAIFPLSPLWGGPLGPFGAAMNWGLLELDGGAGRFQLRLRLLGVLLGDPLEHRLRCPVDEVLGLLEAEAREGADLLDDVDLLLAGGDEDHVELVLLLGTRGGTAAVAAGSRGHRHCR